MPHRATAQRRTAGPRHLEREGFRVQGLRVFHSAAPRQSYGLASYGPRCTCCDKTVCLRSAERRREAPPVSRPSRCGLCRLPRLPPHHCKVRGQSGSSSKGVSTGNATSALWALLTVTFLPCRSINQSPPRLHCSLPRHATGWDDAPRAQPAEEDDFRLPRGSLELLGELTFFRINTRLLREASCQHGSHFVHFAHAGGRTSQ